MPILQQWYFYAERLAWLLADLLPPPFRKLAFLLAFKKYGHGSCIDYGCRIRYPWKVSIGESTNLNASCRIYPSLAVKGAEIIIGSHVLIAPEVSIFGAGHDYGANMKDVAATVRIGDRVWIGARSIILPSVEIGEGSIIGAGSVVTRSIPPWSIAVGNPARVIKQRERLPEGSCSC